MYKKIIILLLAISLNCYGQTYLKLNGEEIMGHSFIQHGEYTVEVNDIRLVNRYGEYEYKYIAGKLIKLSVSEINNHPVRLQREARLAAEKVQRDTMEQKKDQLKLLLPALKAGTIFLTPEQRRDKDIIEIEGMWP